MITDKNNMPKPKAMTETTTESMSETMIETMTETMSEVMTEKDPGMKQPAPLEKDLRIALSGTFSQEEENAAARLNRSVLKKIKNRQSAHPLSSRLRRLAPVPLLAAAVFALCLTAYAAIRILSAPEAAKELALRPLPRPLNRRILCISTRPRPARATTLPF